MPKKNKLEELKKKIENLDLKKLGIKSLNVEIVEKNWQAEKTKFLKIIIDNPRRIPDVRDGIKDWDEVEETYEYDIVFHKRYIIDKQIEPMGWIEVEGEEMENKNKYQAQKIIKASSVKSIELEKEVEFKILAFDTEFIEEDGKSRLIMLSLADNNGLKKVLTSHSWKGMPSYVEALKDEKSLIERFIEIVRENDPDFLVGYNCLPYDEEIILENGLRMPIGKYIEKYEKIKFKPRIMGMVNNKICPVNVIRTWKYNNHKQHKIIKIKTRTGKELRVTYENKLPIGTDRGLEWKKAKDIRVGELIATPKIIKIKCGVPKFIDIVRNNRRVTDKFFVKWIKKKLLKKFKTYRNVAKILDINFNTLKSCKGFWIKDLKELILPLLDLEWKKIKRKIREIDRIKLPKIDVELMYIAGLLAADGSIERGNRNELYLANTDKKLIREFKRIVKKKFGKKVKEDVIYLNSPKQKDRIHAKVSCSLLKDFLNSIGIPSGEKDKVDMKLSKIFSFKEKLIGAFIAGLIDGDGYVHARTTQKQKSFYISSKNKITKTQIKKLLTRLGIVV
ncbi:MAG: 3'-5' exonuclease, partial [Candidatus Ratteibacteria bacterium]